jgi:hypothetical protein
MPEPTNPNRPKSPLEPNRANDEELTRLRTRVIELETELLRQRAKEAQLETELSHKQTPNEEVRRRTSEILRDIPDTAMRESAKIARGVTLASVEHLRLASDVLDAFADEVFQRNRSTTNASVTELAWNLPRDLYAGWLNAVDRSLQIPNRIIDKFYQTYNETDQS